jgi:hypothetical protein
LWCIGKSNGSSFNFDQLKLIENEAAPNNYGASKCLIEIGSIVHLNASFLRKNNYKR